MQEIYEKISVIGTGDNISTSVEVVEKKDATHVHICRHEEGESCTRREL